jgi:hypothetical protein
LSRFPLISLDFGREEASLPLTNHLTCNIHSWAV